jgi:hypothetical protein
MPVHTMKPCGGSVGVTPRILKNLAQGVDGQRHAPDAFLPRKIPYAPTCWMGCTFWGREKSVVCAGIRWVVTICTIFNAVIWVDIVPVLIIINVCWRIVIYVGMIHFRGVLRTRWTACGLHRGWIWFNLLKTKRRLLYLKTQPVPRCKHFLSGL